MEKRSVHLRNALSLLALVINIQHELLFNESG
jgi:hypothetical protein